MLTIINWVLGICTFLGGIAAIWYFGEKYKNSKTSNSASTAAVNPVEKWVDIRYPADSGLQTRLEGAGFRVAWCSDKNLARRVDLEGWKVVTEPDANQILSVYRLKDSPQNQTLIYKKERRLRFFLGGLAR